MIDSNGVNGHANGINGTNGVNGHANGLKGHSNGTNGHANGAKAPIELDALIVGAGFGGCYQLKTLREKGYNVLLVESGSNYGGVWYWNRYPGARVDSTTPHYEFSDPAVWKNWKWRQRFPGSAELRDYFSHVADVWGLRKDTRFDTFIKSATWDDTASRWRIESDKGDIYIAKFFSLNVGFAAKRHIPDWKGIDTFKGTFVHPSYWPHEEPDLAGKKIAVIGTGSTGLQLATELADVAGHLAVFQRTPNTAMPMGQVDYDPATGEQAIPFDKLADFFASRTKSFGGFDFDFLPRATFGDDEETRRATYEKLWAAGDFKFWLATYYDMLFSADANREAYNFWRDKVRARIDDPRARDLVAPMKQPYAFGCKRIALEERYFDIYNRDNVSLIDVNATPIQEITPNGIRTSEKEWEFDYIICATGYDAVTGGLAQIDIRGDTNNGESLAQHWKNGAMTYLGMASAGFPNMFFTYGPQAPTALCNGPTCAEVQGNWVASAMDYMKEKGLKKMVAQPASEIEWKQKVLKFAHASLLPSTKSWYMGDNIPGKPREPLIYLGGVKTYYGSLANVAENDFEGFRLE